MSVSLVKRPSTAVLVALDLVRERDPVTAQYLEDAVVVAAMTALLNREIEFRSDDWGPNLNEVYREPIFTRSALSFLGVGVPTVSPLFFTS